MPIFHPVLAPEGRVIEREAWTVYRDEGWVDSPDKLPPIQEQKEEPPVYAQYGVPEHKICVRCGREKHKGFCKKPDKEEVNG